MFLQNNELGHFFFSLEQSWGNLGYYKLLNPMSNQINYRCSNEGLLRNKLQVQNQTLFLDIKTLELNN